MMNDLLHGVCVVTKLVFVVLVIVFIRLNMIYVRDGRRIYIGFRSSLLIVGLRSSCIYRNMKKELSLLVALSSLVARRSSSPTDER